MHTAYPMIDAQHLSIRYGDIKVLDDLSFIVKQGSITGIIGPNGSGKTTLLKILVGLLAPDAGVAYVMGRQPHESRSKVGYVPQRFLYDRTFPLSVHEFISPRAHKNSGIEKTLKEVGLLHKQTALIGTLSAGEMQRVLMARTLLRNPELLFLDEAASEIDIVGEQTFYGIIAHLNKAHGKTVVFVSHELDIIYRYADTVLCLNHKLICDGTPINVLTKETLQNLYGRDVGVFRHS